MQSWILLPLLLLVLPSAQMRSALSLFRAAPVGRPALLAPWLSLGGGAHALSSAPRRSDDVYRTPNPGRGRVRLSDAEAARGRGSRAPPPKPKQPAVPTREYRGVTDRSKPKRKMCLHLGFLGSRYRGFLYQNEDLPTVELELLRALNKWGGISDDNANLPSKVNWSRASRTDKGVHAIGATVSLKLLVADEELDDLPAADANGYHGNVTVITEARLAELNALLPADIRVFCIQRTRGGFNAYEACSARRYRYLLPESALGPGGALALSEILRKFTGTKAFHNFAAGVRNPPTEVDMLNAVLPEELGWPLAVHPLRPKSEAFRTVLKCEVMPLPVRAVEGEEALYAVQIHGCSFVLHQIRHMIGAALAVAHGLVPLSVFEIALSSPFKVDVSPLAPGEGLSLLSNEFYNEKTKLNEVALPQEALDAMEQFACGALAEHIGSLYREGTEKASTMLHTQVGTADSRADGAGGELTGGAGGGAELDLEGEVGGEGEEEGDDSGEGSVKESAGNANAPRSERRARFAGWAAWQEQLLTKPWLEPGQAENWEQLEAAHVKWQEAVERNKTERTRVREDRVASGLPAANTEAGAARERERAARLVPSGTQTAVAVAFELTPGPELDGLMDAISQAVGRGEVPSGAPPGDYVDFLRFTRRLGPTQE